MPTCPIWAGNAEIETTQGRPAPAVRPGTEIDRACADGTVTRPEISIAALCRSVGQNPCAAHSPWQRQASFGLP